SVLSSRPDNWPTDRHTPLWALFWALMPAHRQEKRMASFRIVEQPRGSFRVERKGWLFWVRQCFYKSSRGAWLMTRGEPAFSVSPVWFPPEGAVYSFATYIEARDAYTEACLETEYRKVVWASADD